ncbi:LOW QUALITY PROTEIN: natural cytotoxicity triggering receptor 2 [Dama dama]
MWPGDCLPPPAHNCCCCCPSQAQHPQKVSGQDLSVRCQYPYKARPYDKAWCKVSTLVCTRLVTNSTTTVTMTGLREEDSGHYWYRIYHTSGCSVSKPVKFYPVVSPVGVSAQAAVNLEPGRAWRTTWQVALCVDVGPRSWLLIQSDQCRRE